MAFPAPAPRDYSVYREGGKLVVSRLVSHGKAGAALPAACVRCGAPAAGTVSMRFGWTERWVRWLVLLGFLPYVLAALALRRWIVLEVPYCAPHRSRRRILVALATALPLCGLGYVLLNRAAAAHSTLVALVLPLGVIAGLVVGLCARTLVPVEIDAGGATFKGAGEGFLGKLP